MGHAAMPRMRERVDQRMRKIVFSLLALFAFGALFAATASAEETLLALWLWNNAEVLELLSTTTTGGITLEDTNAIAGLAGAVLCTATADGSVGANGEDETTEILNAANLAIGDLPSGRPLLGTGAASGEGSECKRVAGCVEGTAASPIEVWVHGLPWHTTLFLDATTGLFLVLITGTGEIGYEILCLDIFGANHEDLCSAPNNDFEFEVVNDPEDVAIPEGAQTEPAANCTTGGAGTGLNFADALTFILPLEGLLSVSSE